jgi:hypothetical protein
MERRGLRYGASIQCANQQGEEPMSKAKPYCISKQEVWEAYKRVKANQGAAGVDEQSIADFERNLKRNLYKIWNRMSSGSYFPPPVRAVEIEKDTGGKRKLGIPTVSDRIAQMVVKVETGAGGGPAVPSGFLRVSTGEDGIGCSGAGAAAMLAL